MSEYRILEPMRQLVRILLVCPFILPAQLSLAATSPAATGIRALDETAIPLEAPGTVFLDAITVAGRRIVAVGAHGVIIYSDDNAKSWTQAHVPVAVTLTAVAFADSLHGWAVGNSGVILYTNDAGKIWQVQLTGIQANRLALIAAQKAMSESSTDVGAPLAIKRANRLIAMGPSVPLLSILALSSQRVIAFGAYKMTMTTDDGGKNWTDFSLKMEDPVSHHLYDATQIGGNIYVVGEAGLVFRSVDGGNSFPLASKAGSGTLFGVIGTGDGGVLVYGVAGLMYRSNDEGKTWVQILMPSAADLTGATVSSTGDIFIVSESGMIYESTDRGLSFDQMRDILPMANYAVAQAPDGTMVIVGNRGVMTVSSK